MLYNYMFIYNYNLSLKEISLYRYTYNQKCNKLLIYLSIYLSIYDYI